MKITSLLFTLFTLIASNLIAQDFEWAKSTGGLLRDEGDVIVADDFGNVYTIGEFQGTVDFNPGAGVFNLTSNGGYDVFVQKLNSMGDFIWAKQIGGTGNNYTDDITLDGSGNIIFSGTFTGIVDMDPNGSIFNLNSTNGYSFVIKLDSSGVFDFAIQTFSRITSIKTDEYSNIYTSGTYSSTVDFDPGAGVFDLNSVGASSDIFIQKLDQFGAFIFAKSIGGTGNEVIGSLDIDRNQNIYLTGGFNDIMDADPNAGTFNLTSNGNKDAFVCKLNNMGEFEWAKSFGALNYDTGVEIRVDTIGNIYSTGTYTGIVDLDPGAGIQNTTSATFDSFYLVKLDSSGNFIYGHEFSTSAGAFCNTLALDVAQDVYLGGSFSTVMDFDPGVGVFNVDSNLGDDAFILKLDKSGDFSFVRTITGDIFSHTESIYIDSSLNIYAAGHFAGLNDFNTDAGVQNITSNGNLDAFVLKLSQCETTFGTDVQTACNSYLWIDGNTYTSDNNIATHTLTNTGGCDSIVTLDLTINYSNGSTDVQTACDSYLWIDGVTYTSSNTIATHTLTNTAGCDSIVTLDLTVNYSNASTDVQTACDSYLWIDGVTYTSSNNIATHTLTNTSGCDSIVTLDLTVNYSNASVDVQTACDSYLWIDGVAYTSSNNVATHTLTNAAGCDSIVTLDLTVNYSNGSTDVQTACDSYLWIDGNTYTSSNNAATHTLTNAAGCDSIVTLDLTINYSNASTDVQTACDSYLWIDGVTYTSSNNVATQTYTNASGCDSIVTLDLTVNYSNGSTDVQTACDSYLWIDGVTYTSSNNSATQTYTNAAGCDSIVTLDLTVNYSNASTDVQTACDSYLWIDGNTYTSSNNAATQTFTNAAGCDSIVTLDLTINYSDATTDVQTACDSYLWIDGVTYTSSNTIATQTYTNAAGCDSTVTLDLTINNSSASTDVQTACDSYVWIDGNTYTSNNNSAAQTLTNAAGCDSIVILDLTINTVNISTTTTGVTITSDAVGVAYQWIDCSDYSEIIGETNQSFTATINGDYAVIVTENGCSDTSTCVVINSIGINENDELNNVVIYPNPNNGIIHLELGSLSDVDIRVFSVQGKLVLEEKMINLPLHQIEFKAPSGVYYLKIQSEGISKTYKLIKNK
ncbi:MAG: hypothetical protein ACJA1C_002507 [Crocinitomicaceae bacterium]|jgi:hypothetical protein